MKVIFWKKKLIFTEIILLFIRQNTIPCGQSKGIVNAFDQMGFCLDINLIMGGNHTVTWSPIIATRYLYVSFAISLKTRAQLFKAS